MPRRCCPSEPPLPLLEGRHMNIDGSGTTQDPYRFVVTTATGTAEYLIDRFD